MTRADRWKLLGVVLATVLAIIALYPSVVFYRLPAAQRSGGTASISASQRKKALHLGLDLQGGMHLVLEVDRSKMNAGEAKDAVDRAMEVLRHRIDQFGVAEPLVQREGEDRIVIQLPGLTDRERALELIGKTALLEFKLVRTNDEARNILNRVDSYLAAHGTETVGDSTLRRTPLSRHLLPPGAESFVPQADIEVVRKLLATAGLDSIIPDDSQILWGTPNEVINNQMGQMFYILKRAPEIGGGAITNAVAGINPDPAQGGSYQVQVQMTSTSQADFARVTGDNVGRHLAIVLDNVVNSAPNILQRIPDGRPVITGRFDAAAAKDLAIVLRAGALPAPVRVIEERSVGPSLGADSIQDGVRAGLIGTALVVLFMVIYYHLSGIIAIVAMVLNIVYLVAYMAGFGATLTLPGMAGIVLTIGMSVDANVLIFERIREELRNQRSVRQAVNLGYDRAFRTILDAHVTTIISALFLFGFGTGPIKGFALTLVVGLIANMFTAVVFTRMVFDFMLSRGKAERISI